jgi:hypothetical protein
VDKVERYIEAVKATSYTHDIIKWDLKNKIFIHNNNPEYEPDTLDYIQYGKMMANSLQEEISFHCFYLAHLKDHENIDTNGDLKFNTYEPVGDTNKNFEEND